MTAPVKAPPSKRRGALTETLDEFLTRVGAYEPLSPDVWVRVKAIFEAPLPPRPSETEGGDK